MYQRYSVVTTHTEGRRWLMSELLEISGEILPGQKTRRYWEQTERLPLRPHTFVSISMPAHSPRRGGIFTVYTFFSCHTSCQHSNIERREGEREREKEREMEERKREREMEDARRKRTHKNRTPVEKKGCEGNRVGRPFFNVLTVFACVAPVSQPLRSGTFRSAPRLCCLCDRLNQTQGERTSLLMTAAAKNRLVCQVVTEIMLRVSSATCLFLLFFF